MQHQAQNLSRKGSHPIEQQGTHANGMMARRKGLALWCRSNTAFLLCCAMITRLPSWPTSAHRRAVAASHTTTPSCRRTSRRTVLSVRSFLGFTVRPLYFPAPSPPHAQRPRTTTASPSAPPNSTSKDARFDCGEHGPVEPQMRSPARLQYARTRRAPHEHPPHRARQRAHPRARREACFSPRRGLSRRSGEEEEITARPCCYLWRWTWTRRRLRADQAMRQKGLREPIHANITISPTALSIKFHRVLRHIWQSEGRRMYSAFRFSIILCQWSVSHIFFTTVAQFRFSLQHLHCYVHFGSFGICLRSGLPSLTVRGPRVRIPVRSVQSADLRPAAKFRY
ncbi:hypothetical protein C8J57DRAFT_1396776 [Mycena rebaudengoi]|nr:hypothetical protein C8J57DRAFT_1396776 [Mycena rebaudengoi]